MDDCHGIELGIQYSHILYSEERLYFQTNMSRNWVDLHNDGMLESLEREHIYHFVL